MVRVGQREAAVQRRQENVQGLLQLQGTHLKELLDGSKANLLIMTPDWFYNPVEYSALSSLEPYVVFHLVLWNLSVHSVSLAPPTISARINKDPLAQSPSLVYPLPQALTPCSQNHISLRQPVSQERAIAIRKLLQQPSPIEWFIQLDSTIAVQGINSDWPRSLRVEIRSNSP